MVIYFIAQGEFHKWNQQGV